MPYLHFSIILNEAVVVICYCLWYCIVSTCWCDNSYHNTEETIGKMLTNAQKDGQNWSWILLLLGHRSQRLQWPIVITRCPASVRRPSVRRPLNYLHFRLLLQNRLMDFDETWYGWSTQGPLQVLLFFGQIRPGADPGRGKNRSQGVPFFRKLLLQTGRLQQQTECITVI